MSQDEVYRLRRPASLPVHLAARYGPEYGLPAPGYGSAQWKDGRGLPDLPSLQAAEDLECLAYPGYCDRRLRQLPVAPDAPRYCSLEENWSAPSPAPDEVTMQLRRTAAHLLQSPETACRRAQHQLQPPASQRRYAHSSLLSSSMLLAETLGASSARLPCPGPPHQSRCANLSYASAPRRAQQPMRAAVPAYAQHLHPSFPDRGPRAAGPDTDLYGQPQQSEPAWSLLQTDISPGCVSHFGPDLHPMDSVHAAEEADCLQVPMLFRRPQLPQSGRNFEALRQAQLYFEPLSPSTLLPATPVHQQQRHVARQRAVHEENLLSTQLSSRFSPPGYLDPSCGPAYMAADAKAQQYMFMLEAGSSSEGSPTDLIGTPQLPVGTYATPCIPTPLNADSIHPATPIPIVPVLESSPSDSPAETTAAADHMPEVPRCASAEDALIDIGSGSVHGEDGTLLRSSDVRAAMPIIPGPTTQVGTATAQASGELPPITPANPPSRQREQVLKRYSEKKRRRLHAKTIRYHKRKVNADNRPRIKGRFVKASEAALMGIPIPPQQQLGMPQQQQLQIAPVQHVAVVPDCLRQHSEDPDASVLGSSLLDPSFDLAGRFLTHSGLLHAGMLAECDSLDLDISHHEA